MQCTVIHFSYTVLRLSMVKWPASQCVSRVLINPYCSSMQRDLLEHGNKLHPARTNLDYQIIFAEATSSLQGKNGSRVSIRN